MNDRLARLARKNLKMLSEDPRPFYYAEERIKVSGKPTLRRAFYVASRTGESPKQGSLDKINAHLSRRAKDEAFSKKARICAGVVRRRSRGVHLEIMVRKGVGASQLIKGVRKLNVEKKLGLTGPLKVGKTTRHGRHVDVDERKVSRRSSRTPEQQAERISALFERLRSADPIPPAKLDRLLRRLARFEESGGDPSLVEAAQRFAEAAQARLHEGDEEDEGRVLEREIQTWLSELDLMESDVTALIEEDAPVETLELAAQQIEGGLKLLAEARRRLDAFLAEED